MVLGNCQANSMAACLRVMLPSDSISHLNIHRADAKVLQREIENAETIVTHRIAAGARQDWVNGSKAKVQLYPRVTFMAFHPDYTHVLSGEKKVMSPLGDPHSALIFHAWRNGISKADTVNLFNRGVFEKLGYFDLFDASMKAAKSEGDATGFDLPSMVRQWLSRGSFLHTINHVKLFAISDLARQVCKMIGVQPKIEYPEDVIPDPALVGPGWPIYPEVADRYGLRGSRVFKLKDNAVDGTKGSVLDLVEFVDRSFAAYAEAKGRLECAAADTPRYASISAADVALEVKPTTPKPKDNVAAAPVGKNPYKGLPDYHYWRRSVSGIQPSELDPVVDPRFQIGMTDRIGTAGSCFAQHIANRLQSSGYHYYVAEAAPAGMSAEEAARQNYGVYSARYANVYTARQLLQLFKRASGGEGLDTAEWVRPDGRIVDPFRPEITPDGFETKDAMIRSRHDHLTAVAAVMKQSDVFVFTLGLTECWEDAHGIVTPIAPGIVAAPTEEQGFRFKNLSVTEVIDDLTEALVMLRSVNPNVRVVLTVSPVPLVATFEKQHVLTATNYSKAVLRVAADEMKRKFDFVDYFPSYEIITSSSNRGRYFDDDLRSVKTEGVSHVMRVFLNHYCGQENTADIAAAKAAQDIVCEEELLDS
nr:GSCFA domain-containing protein [Agrobacterium sp. a22-2]